MLFAQDIRVQTKLVSFILVFVVLSLISSSVTQAQDGRIPLAQATPSWGPELPTDNENQQTLENVPNDPTIIGGQDASPGEWPWQVGIALFGSSPAATFCGGSLISAEWVVTAAHCTYWSDNEPISPFLIQLFAGIQDLVNPESGFQRINVEQVIRHPLYDPTEFDNDIALIKLATPAQLGPTSGGLLVNPVNLISASVGDLAGQSSTVTGWGETEFGLPAYLQEVSVPIISNANCAQAWGNYITANMLCAGYNAGGYGPCFGDSGGPLVVQDNASGVWRLAGIVSFGSDPCALPSVPAVFTRVSRYTNWIDDYVPLGGQDQGDSIGLYNQDWGKFLLRNQLSSGPWDHQFRIGPSRFSPYIPITGDWDGDGNDTIGLYYWNYGKFVLRNSNSAGSWHIIFDLGPRGNSNLFPIAGDWNGDGIDTIGLYNPRWSQFLLRNSNSAGAWHANFTFGPHFSPFVPIAGDWNGDGIDTIGLYNTTWGRFVLRNSNSSGSLHIAFNAGPRNSTFWPVVGDWNGDGIDTTGLYHSTLGKFVLRNSHTAGPWDIAFNIGPRNSPFYPIAGNWDGN